jgi:hypothetical protein
MGWLARLGIQWRLKDAKEAIEQENDITNSMLRPGIVHADYVQSLQHLSNPDRINPLKQPRPGRHGP